MAIMIPDKPMEFHPWSREDELFKALEEGLPNDFYVFHSFKIDKVKNNTEEEHEIDFVVFNKDYGLLCIEAKAGSVSYNNRTWYYASGKEMKHGGPFEQARRRSHDLYDYFVESGRPELVSLGNNCVFTYAVWFPSINEDQLNKLSLVSDCPKKRVLTKESLIDPLEGIKKVFSIDYPSGKKTTLTKEQEKKMVYSALSNHFDLTAVAGCSITAKKMIFHKLLKEQSNILNFLGEQRTAVINGAAGTGKTVVAVEKARRHALSGDKVLFLCYNKKLKEHLEKNYSDENIDYYTLDGYGCNVCKTSEVDYSLLEDKLFEKALNESFEYKHVIIDEGQDFGVKADEEESVNIVGLLKEAVINSYEDSTFYVFYDMMQLIQYNRDVPKFISDADCKLTLYKNCRNTKKIAETSMSPLINLKRKVVMNYETKEEMEEDTVKMYFSDNDNVCSALDSIIKKIAEAGYDDIVILTPKTEKTSVISKSIVDGKYGKYPVSTCRKFKGLEADAIIFIDIDNETFINDEVTGTDNSMLFYVGTSRARYSLSLLSTMDDSACKDILTSYFNYEKVKKPKKELADSLKAHLSAI